jgi:hypothetical protein
LWNRLHSGGDEQRLSFPTAAKKERSVIMKARVSEERELLNEANHLYQLTIKGDASL